MSAPNTHYVEVREGVAPADVVDDLQSSGGSLFRIRPSKPITSQRMLENEASFLQVAQAQVRLIHTKLDPICAAANSTHERATALRKEMIAPIAELVMQSKRRMEAWVEAEDRRIAAEEKAARDAEEKAARDAKEEEARVTREAEALAAAGKNEEAESLIDDFVDQREEEEQAPPSPLAERMANRSKSSKISTSREWSLEVVDLAALKLAWAQGKGGVPADAFELKQGVLNRLARATKENTNVPGCRAVSRAKVAGRR